ncbi:LOW QUALITY PROTEIN: DNA mismatch repair protein MutL-like isoform X2 [Vespula squamosa]|uniref:DNA mismatch repair protein MutL-like isoform X2 n=1 Tax=Vespula squamosa TaxID=30214 RepID=A0ABD2ADK9_VESSQ
MHIQQTVNTLDNQIDIPNKNIIVDLGKDFKFDFILNEISNRDHRMAFYEFDNSVQVLKYVKYGVDIIN